MSSKSLWSTKLRNLLILGVTVVLMQSCANERQTKYIPRPRFFTSCLARQLNPPPNLKSSKSNPANSKSTKFLYALVVSSFSEYSPMLMLSDNGTAIVADHASPTGYTCGHMKPIQLEEFKKLGSELCSLKTKDYGSEISITDLPSTYFYVTDSLGNHQRIHIYGDFDSNEFWMSEEDKRDHCIVPEVLKNAFRSTMEARKEFTLNREGSKQTSEVWTPERLSFVLTKITDDQKSASTHSVEFKSSFMHEALEEKYTIKKNDLNQSEIDTLLLAYLENYKIKIQGQLYSLALTE